MARLIGQGQTLVLYAVNYGTPQNLDKNAAKLRIHVLRQALC